MRCPVPRSIMLQLPLAAVLAIAPAGEATAAAPAAPSGADAALALLDSRGQTEALLAALGVSGLRGPLAEMGDLTVLAPTDEAFGRIPTREVTRLFDEGSRGRLQRILTAHVIPGALDAAALLEMGQVTTVGGVTLDVELAGGQLLIGGAAVSTNDLRCEGGVVHELAAVIDPSSAAADPVQRLACRALDLGEGLDAAGQAAVFELALESARELGRQVLPLRARPGLEARAAALREEVARLISRSPEPTMNEGPGDDARLLIDFAAEGEPRWFTLNDDVMGGISSSRFDREEPSIGVFSGALSLENNGGFATIRSRSEDFELEGTRGIRVRLKGDGREYGLSVLAGDERGRSGSWRKKFTAPAGEWVVLDVPYEEMVLNVRGRRFPDVGPPDPAGVRSFSFIIADKDETPFRLEVDWIAAYR